MVIQDILQKKTGKMIMRNLLMSINKIPMGGSDTLNSQAVASRRGVSYDEKNSGGHILESSS